MGKIFDEIIDCADDAEEFVVNVLSIVLVFSILVVLSPLWIPIFVVRIIDRWMGNRWRVMK